MISIALKSDSVSSLEPGLGFSNSRGRGDNEKAAAVAQGERMVVPGFKWQKRRLSTEQHSR